MSIICPMCGNENVANISLNYYKCNHCNQWFQINSNPYDKKIEPTEEAVNWDLVEEQISINTKDRFNWREYFGISLTRVIARLKAQGLNSDEVYSELCKTHPDLSVELKRRLKIGCAARFGEIATAESEKNGKKKEKN